MKTEKKVRINEIVKSIDELSSELRQLLIEDEPARAVSESESKKTKTILVGTRIKVTVKYGGYRNMEGTVIKIKPFYLTIRMDNGDIIKKQKSSVKIID